MFNTFGTPRRHRMSGICGIVRFDHHPVAARDLERQMARLAHLGPDRARTWTAGPIGLGHLMMGVTREDAFDAQPLSDGGLTLSAASIRAPSARSPARS